MSLVKTNANEPLKRRHNDPNRHQNRVFVYGPGRVRRLPDYRSGGGWREGGVSARQAYQRVKANKGAAGIDGQTIEDFERDLKGNLFKIWNRLTSGSYLPPAVMAVTIPKRAGGTRMLGIPTLSDRIAQTVVKMYLEPILEPHFHEDSYGYRPGKSALQAVSKTRQRCWRYGWLYEFDIKGAFDNIDHELLLRALRKHTDCKWVLMYIERWLTAPIASGWSD